MLESTVKRILNAKVYDVAEVTPLDYAHILSSRLNNHVWFKREDLQTTFSFKLRGAYNRISQLTEEQRTRGVIAASAGNHAQGVAMASAKLGIKSTIVMPRTTPSIKVDSVRRLGGKVVLHGDAYDEAAVHAEKLTKEKGLTFVHPFDDDLVIAGQGTIGKELLEQSGGKLDAVFVPVGGGGLIAGITAYIKYLRPDIKIIGVEPEDTPTLHAAMAAGKRVTLKSVGIFADGVAVKQIGKRPFELVKGLVDEVVLVNVDQICAAISDMFDDTRSIPEPAGALAIAGAKAYVARTGVTGQNFAVITSGANMNFHRLRHVSERAEIGEGREALLAVTIPETPGSFRAFCKKLGRRSVTEFNYRYADSSQAVIFVGVSLSGGSEERKELITSLEGAGLGVTDLTDNEVAKLHSRYTVGGRTGDTELSEQMFRFEFPERPGALGQFLDALGKRWNITLFHYRNHGAAYGRVLVAFEGTAADKKAILESLKPLGYTVVDESLNPVYELFLK
jgi:threonine dehydratase